MSIEIVMHLILIQAVNAYKKRRHGWISRISIDTVNTKCDVRSPQPGKI